MGLDFGMDEWFGGLWVWIVEWMKGWESYGFGMWNGSRVRKVMGLECGMDLGFGR